MHYRFNRSWKELCRKNYLVIIIDTFCCNYLRFSLVKDNTFKKHQNLLLSITIALKIII